MFDINTVYKNGYLTFYDINSVLLDYFRNNKDLYDIDNIGIIKPTLIIGRWEKNQINTVGAQGYIQGNIDVWEYLRKFVIIKFVEEEYCFKIE